MAKNITKTETTVTAAVLEPLRQRLDNWEVDREGMFLQAKIGLDTRLIEIIKQRAHAMLDILGS